MGKGKVARLMLYDYINGIAVGDLNSNYNLGYGLKHPIETTVSYFLEKIADKIQQNHSLKMKFQKALKSEKINQYNSILRKKFFLRLAKVN